MSAGVVCLVFCLGATDGFCWFGPLHAAYFCLNGFIRNYFSMTHFLTLIGSDILHEKYVSLCRNWVLFSCFTLGH